MKSENIIKLILIYWILLGTYALFFDAGFRELGGGTRVWITETRFKIVGQSYSYNWSHIFNMWVLIPLVIATINKIIFKK